MKDINWNLVAKRVAELEGKKKEISIAQIKEIIYATMRTLKNNFDDVEILLGIEHLLKRRRK